MRPAVFMQLLVGVLVAGMVATSWLAGCTKNQMEYGLQDGLTMDYLPTGASDVKVVGNGWVTFRLDGRQFLMSAHSHAIGITQIQ